MAKFVLNRKAFKRQVLQDPVLGQEIVTRAKQAGQSIGKPHDVSVYPLSPDNGRVGAMLMCHGKDERKHGSLSQTRGALT